MREIFFNIWHGFADSSLVEQVATVLGVWGVWLMIRQRLLAFPVGLLQVVLSAIVFARSGFYADMCLQVVFFICLAYGWWHWRSAAQTGADGSAASWMSRRHQLLSVLTALAVGSLWGFLQSRYTAAPFPYRDAFISSFSIVAQWLQSRRRVENWLFWIGINAFAVPSYWRGGMHWFSALYFVFLVMGVLGFIAWWRSGRSSSSGAASLTPAPASTSSEAEA